MIEEILLRLPVKSLIRFKCVRKSWFSLISDPHFANSHFELSASPSHRHLFFNTASGSEPRSHDIKDVSIYFGRIIRSPLPKAGKGDEDVRIIGTCRGLVLLRRYLILCLWNPSTGFHRNLLYPEIYSNAKRRLNLFGLGYDPSTNDYLAVVSCQSGLVLFSFRTNSWKEIHVDLVPYEAPHLIYYRYQSDQCGLFFNGAIHWLAYRYRQLDEMTVVLDEVIVVIVVFDLIKRNLSEISMPIGDLTNSTFHNLQIMGGCLGVSFLRGYTTHMRVMKEYKVHSSWTEIPPTKHLSLPRICLRISVQLLDNKGVVLLPVMYTESLLSLPIDCVGSM